MPDVMEELDHSEEHVLTGELIHAVGREVPLRARRYLTAFEAILRREFVLRSIDNLPLWNKGKV